MRRPPSDLREGAPDNQARLPLYETYSLPVAVLRMHIRQQEIEPLFRHTRFDAR